MLYKGVKLLGVRAIRYHRTKKINDFAPKISILSPSYAKLQIQNVLDVLNSSSARVPRWLDGSSWDWQIIDRTEMQEELRRLIAEWNKSGPDLNKLFRQNPKLQASCSGGTTLLIPTRDGSAQLAWTPHKADHQNSSQKDIALTHFIEFLVNPFSLKLGGPCGRCDKFYIKNTKRQKTYCSYRCGAANTALSTTQRKRQADYSKKLLLAQRLIEEWGHIHARKPWKEWISTKTKNEITVKWLTRAVNLGKLAPPI